MTPSGRTASQSFMLVVVLGFGGAFLVAAAVIPQGPDYWSRVIWMTIGINALVSFVQSRP